MAKKKVEGEVLVVVNRDGQEVRRYSAERHDDERSSYVEKAEEFVAKNNKNGADYRIEKA